MFANIYLNEVDQYVKHVLHCKYYFRYLDDSVAMFKTKEEAKQALDKIKEFLATNLELELNEKTQIFKSKQGVNFCGYKIKPYRLKNDTLRKDKKIREYLKFTEEDFKKDYRLIFLNKSRRGEDDIVMLLKFNGINGSFEEIGICEHVHRGALSY